MKKTKRLTASFLSLAMLALVACANGTDSSSAESTPDTSDNTSEVSTSSDDSAVSTSEESSEIISSDVDSSTTEESSTSSSYDPYAEGWSRTATDTMLKHLVIPIMIRRSSSSPIRSRSTRRLGMMPSGPMTSRPTSVQSWVRKMPFLTSICIPRHRPLPPPLTSPTQVR